jgi:hypothetical protein
VITASPTSCSGPEYHELAERYGITIQDDWIKDLESTYGIKALTGRRGELGPGRDHSPCWSPGARR